MIYTAIDTFYLSDEQLKDSPSRKDGIDESTETTLRIYGCDLIQESGILLKLPQAVMATGQVLLHRFYCKKSFARFNVKRVAASCVWLASKLEESPKKARHIVLVFHRMECRRENQPAEHLDISSKRYAELKIDLNRTERHLLKEMGFICHVEHPHKFISNYLVTLGAPHELRQIAWNLANDSLRTTLCVRFKGEVVACGVVYAAARRFEAPLPENPPWWKVFDADKAGIDEVCRVLAHLYSLPKAQYISVCKDGDSFTSSYKIKDSPAQQVLKEGLLNSQVAGKETGMNNEVATADSVGAKDSLLKLPLGKTDGDTRSEPIEGETRKDSGLKFNTDSQTGGRNKEDRDWERPKSRERDRGRDSDMERDRDKLKERSRHSKDRRKDSDAGHSDKSRHYSSRDRSEYRTSSHSSRDKDRHRHQS